MKPLRSHLSGALLLALVLPAAADAATYTMRASVPGMAKPVPKEPAYNKTIDPGSFTGYWSGSRNVEVYGDFSDWISAYNYAVSVAGLDEAQWGGARKENTPCAGVGEYHDYFEYTSSNSLKAIYVYRQLCAATENKSLPYITPTGDTSLRSATVPTPAGWGVWGPPSLKTRHPPVLYTDIPAFMINELGLDPAFTMEMTVGSACKHIGESRDFAVGLTNQYLKPVEVRTQTCNAQ